jgi:hypothetical protein
MLLERGILREDPARSPHFVPRSACAARCEDARSAKADTSPPRAYSIRSPSVGTSALSGVIRWASWSSCRRDPPVPPIGRSGPRRRRYHDARISNLTGAATALSVIMAWGRVGA